MKFLSICFLVVLLLIEMLSGEKVPVPKNFILGAGTSAYQIEGAWNTSGKGESIWDRFVHTHPDEILDNSTGDVADDSYHKYKQDVQMAKNMSLNLYRFSISWTRILPLGDLTEINQDGIDYYNNLIDELIKNDIEPMVTISHWDIPQRFQDNFGGWSNPLMSDYFVDFAGLLFETYGDRVKRWLTINEPFYSCTGYAGPEMDFFRFPPQISAPGVGNYMCGYTQLLSHAKTYRLYQKQYKASQNGTIGLAISVVWGIPKTSSAEDQEATDRFIGFQLDWFAHPIFSKFGNYPPIMRERIANLSLDEGLRHSRLPEFTKEDIQLIQGSADFIGLNYYTTFEISADSNNSKLTAQSDIGVGVSWNPAWKKSPIKKIFSIVPEGLNQLINYFHKTYSGYDIIITENGFPDDGRLNDEDRIIYLKLHLNASLSAIYDNGAPLIGYIHWALIDNMEWNSGYSVKFGLGQVNHDDPDLPRTMKKSAYVYKEISESRSITFD